MHTPHVLIPPYIPMRVPQGLERVVRVRQRHPAPVKHVCEEVLVWEFVRRDGARGVEERGEFGGGAERGLEDDDAAVEEVVGAWRGGCDGDGVREALGVGERRVAAVGGDPDEVRKEEGGGVVRKRRCAEGL